MEETSSSAGAVALILGILSLAGAIVSRVGAFGGGAFPEDSYANSINPENRRKVNADFTRNNRQTVSWMHV